MGIKKYKADTDNTISDAYQDDFLTRGTGSNTGRADVLEVFSIYGQVTGSDGTIQTELSRVLINFPVTEITTDRTNSIIPASGSVSFFLNLYNAEHRQSTPQLYTIAANAISGSWEEGYGMDLLGLTDVTHDQYGSSWTGANGSLNAASGSVTITNVSNLAASTHKIDLLTTDGTAITASAHDSTTTTTDTNSPTFDLAAGDNNTTAANLAACLNANSKLTATSEGAEVTITQVTKGRGGNRLINLTDPSSTGMTSTNFRGGDGHWVTTGGDIYTDSSSSFEQHFDTGLEDLSIDITTLVEQWVNSAGNVLGSKGNHGILLKLSSQQEGHSTTNTGGAYISYYTKKFFSRSSEFFFKRPSIEARWDSSRRDNRGNFYISSSMVPGSENLNTLYMYNYIRGNLRDIAGNSAYVPVLNLYYSSGSVPEGAARGFLNPTSSAVTFLSASRESEGIFYATISATSSVVNSTYPYLVDVWTYQYNDDESPNEIHTGSAISPKTFGLSNYNPDSKYVVSIPNLKKSYCSTQAERFRVFIRNKNWSPNVYTKVVATPETLLIDSASYKVVRLADNEVVINYGTSSTNHTVMSYDISGNYFDLDMSLLEPDYMYGLKFAFYEDSLSSYTEQPYVFKFRVIK